MRIARRFVAHVFLLPLALPFASLDAQVFDDFDDDPRDDPSWEFYEPEQPAIYSHDEGFFQVTVPSGVNLDSWTAADRAVQIRRTDMPTDFVAETRMLFLGSGDPEAPIFPPIVQSYQVGLLVNFTQFDLVHWGFYAGLDLAMERSGHTVPRCFAINAFDEVSLRVSKLGTLYTFSWRAFDEDPWTEFCQRNIDVPPTSVGLVFKSWGAPIADTHTFIFDYFRITEEPSPRLENFTPEGADNFHDAAAGFSFTTRTPTPGASIHPENIEIILNGIDISGDLVIAGTPTERSVSYDGLVAGQIYEARITVTDSNGETSSQTHGFGTLTQLEGEFFDDFDDNPLDSPGWQLYDPTGQGIHEHEDSFFRSTLPFGAVLDHWTFVDEAIQLRRYDMPENFEMETLVRFAGSGTPPLWPPTDESYMAGLMVKFSERDVFTWGFRRGSTLAIQRSGEGAGFCTLDPGLQEVELRIRKVVNDYTFGWRQPGEVDWNDSCQQSATEAPVSVGFMLKSWNPPIASDQVFEFENFRIRELTSEAPTVVDFCPSDEDTALVRMPYRIDFRVEGLPEPTVNITSGPASLSYDAGRQELSGWTPIEAGIEAVEIELSNTSGTQTLSWEITVSGNNKDHDEEFDDDPAKSEVLILWDPQPGTTFSLVEKDDGNNWFRMDVPLTGEFGQNFDVWVNTDRGPQLLKYLDTDEDFTIETRLRLDPLTVPAAGNPFFTGIFVGFSDLTSDMLHWTVGQQRSFGLAPGNVILERSGTNNIGFGFVPGLLAGDAVDLRIERKCDQYNCFYRAVPDTEWTLGQTYRTEDVPTHFGIVSKTWGPGTTFSVEYDYFDIVESDGGPPPAAFLRGDADGSGQINITDGIYVLNFLFLGGPDPSCKDAADADDSNAINITDGIYILNFLFLGGPDPKVPYPNCGEDSGEDNISCDEPHEDCT